MGTIYFIREINGKHSFALVSKGRIVFTSHRQDYSRKCDAKEAFYNNGKSSVEKELSRVEFRKKFKK